jgi:transcriptional regulator with XRE-family HTH domain
MDSPLQDWRELLGILTERSAERQRAADELGVTPYTITRWVNRTSEPRLHSLKRLPEVFPRYKQHLADLIEAELNPYKLLQTRSSPDQSLVDTLDVPVEYLIRALSAYARVRGPLRTWSLCSLAIQQILVQLDPDQLGMEVIVVQCVPPILGQSVRSLCERIAVGTAPWSTKVEQRLRFVGAESLAGWTVGRGEPRILQNLGEQEFLLVGSAPHEKSAVAWPIQREGRLAGSLLVVSTQQGYFTPAHLSSIELYTNSLALAFRDEDFYPLSEISLHVMPVLSTQDDHISLVGFRERIVHFRSQHGTPLPQVDAERLVLQEMEASLLHTEGEIERSITL